MIKTPAFPQAAKLGNCQPASPHGAAPSLVPGLSLLVPVPNVWGFVGGRGKLSQHCWVCIRLSWPFPVAQFYVHPRYPKMSLICSLVAWVAPTAGRQWFTPLFLNFPPDAL